MPSITGARQEFFIKRNDRLPVIAATLTSDGSALDLSSTGTTVRFLMRQENSTGLKVNSTASIDGSTTGEVSYSWSTGDTDTAGDYLAEFEVTFASGKKLTAPADDDILVYIRRDLNG